MGKYDCGVCSETTKSCPSNKSGSLQCNTCDNWWHPPCVKVDAGMLELIKKCVDLNMTSPWACTVCTTVWSKLTKEVKQIATKASANEKRIEGLESNGEQLKNENTQMKETIKKLETRMTSVEKGQGENSGEKVMEEIAERGSRERNLVCYKCPEADTTDAEAARVSDMVGVQGLFDHLGLVKRADQVLVGLRRLGKVKEDLQARPLLLIFRNKWDRDMLLERAPRLSKDDDEYWRSINIVADLTQKQRQMEQNMFRRAEEQNMERNHQEVSKNLCWKVLGRRGERVLRQVELRQDEMISTEGKVVRRSSGVQELQRDKRARSPGSTPPARGGLRSMRFGVRE